MATGPGVNQGKGKFLREFLASNRDARVEDATAAWKAEGHDDGISESLVSKIRSELGLTNRRGTSGGPTEADAISAANGKAKSPKGAKGEVTSKEEEAPSQPRGREGDSGPSKSAFVGEVLGREPGANLRKVNEAWASAGHGGSISDSIYYKVKRESGVAGRSAPPAPIKPQPTSSSKGAGAQQAAHATVEGRPESGGMPAPSKSVGGPGSADRERILDRVEDGIDDLIGELKQLGGMEVALEALKKVRRVVVRSHEG